MATIHLSRGARVFIWLQTLASIAVVLAITMLVERELFPAGDVSYSLRLGVAFGLTQLLSAAAIVVAVAASKLLSRMGRHRADRVDPVLRGSLTAYAMGDDAQGLSRLYRRYPRAFERALYKLTFVVEGEPRSRLVRAAERLGVVRRWIRAQRSRRVRTRLRAVRALGLMPLPEARRVLRRRLDDSHDEVQLAAADSLIRLGESDDIEHLFLTAIDRPSLWSRAVLGEALRDHASLLADRVLPDVLRSSDVKRLVAVLEFVQHWQVTLSHDALDPLLVHPDPHVRCLALLTLPRVDGRACAVETLRQGLSDASVDVRAAAATVAGRLRLTDLAPDLTDCLTAGPSPVQVRAAVALAELGDVGLERLEAVAVSGETGVSGVAAEVAEKTRIGRLQFALS